MSDAEWIVQFFEHLAVERGYLDLQCPSSHNPSSGCIVQPLRVTEVVRLILAAIHRLERP